jgi:hypothetical protein
MSFFPFKKTNIFPDEVVHKILSIVLVALKINFSDVNFKKKHLIEKHLPGTDNTGQSNKKRENFSEFMVALIKIIFTFNLKLI